MIQIPVYGSLDSKTEGISQWPKPVGRYKGERNRKNARNGMGQALLPSDDQYIGEYDDGQRHGFGLYVYSSGVRYAGRWACGKRHGRGTFFYPDGSRYEGRWKQGKKHGFGTYYYSNGDKYDGAWKKGLRHGMGEYLYAQSGSRFYGNWVDDKMHGAGQLQHKNYKFYGFWNDNQVLGRGYYEFDDSCTQHGFYAPASDKPQSIYDLSKELQSDEEIKSASELHVHKKSDKKEIIINELDATNWYPQYILPRDGYFLPIQLDEPMYTDDPGASSADDNLDIYDQPGLMPMNVCGDLGSTGSECPYEEDGTSSDYGGYHDMSTLLLEDSRDAQRDDIPGGPFTLAEQDSVLPESGNPHQTGDVTSQDNNLSSNQDQSHKNAGEITQPTEQDSILPESRNLGESGDITSQGKKLPLNQDPRGRNVGDITQLSQAPTVQKDKKSEDKTQLSQAPTVQSDEKSEDKTQLSQAPTVQKVKKAGDTTQSSQAASNQKVKKIGGKSQLTQAPSIQKNQKVGDTTQSSQAASNQIDKKARDATPLNQAASQKDVQRNRTSGVRPLPPCACAPTNQTARLRKRK